MLSCNWDVWPCTHACTAFFSIPIAEIAHVVPPPLIVKKDKHNRGELEVGYVRFRIGTHNLPATEELSWGIAVKRRIGVGFAFYAMNIAADNHAFLDWNEGIGFNVHRPPVRFRSDLDRRSFEVVDDDGPVCVLRHQPEGSIPLPLLPVDTEVWTKRPDGTLARRVFKWRGMAKMHFAASVASSLYNHRFFNGVRVDRAEPLPTTVFASQRVARRAAQLFTAPR
jgi:hypothetical protein